MAEFPIDIVVDPRRAEQGSRRVGSALGGVERSASRMGDAIHRALGVSAGQIFQRVKLGLDGVGRSASSMATGISRALGMLSGQSFQRVKLGFDGVGQSADGMANAVNRALGILGVAGGIAGVKQITSQLLTLVDTFTNIQNRLRTVTNGTQELTDVTDELFRISQRTRQSFESTAELYARVGLASRELGVSQQELLQFTESLNQAIILSGASSQEAQAGLMQLSQGMAAGVLRGENLNSVLEQLPVVADVIAQSMGITRGELRSMGEQGKITADIVLDAFRGSRKELEERFAKAVPTLAQGFQVLSNEAVRLAGAYDRATGASATLGMGLLSVAANMDVLARSTAAAATTLLVVLAGRAIPAAITAIKALSAAIAANPIGAVVVAITAAISGLVYFSDQIGVSADGVATLASVVSAGFSEMGQLFSDLTVYLTELSPAVAALGGPFGLILQQIARLPETMRRFGPAIERVTDSVGGFRISWGGLARTVAWVLDGILDGVSRLSDAVTLMLADIGSSVELGIKSKLDWVAILLNSFGADIPRRALTKRAQKLSEGIVDAFEKPLSKSSIFSDYLERTIAKSRQIAEELANVDVDDVDKDKPKPDGFREMLRQLEQEHELLKLSGDERARRQVLMRFEDELGARFGSARAERVSALVTENLALKRQNAIVESAKSPTEALTQQMEDLSEVYRQGRLSLDEYRAAMRDLTDDGFAGLLQPLERERELLTLSNDERARRQVLMRFEDELGAKFTDARATRVSALMAENTAMRQQNAIVENARSPAGALTQQMGDLTAVYLQGRLELDEYGAAMRSLKVELTEVENSLGGGISNAFARLAARTDEFGERISSTLVSAFDDLTRSFTDFLQTGEFDIRRWASTTVAAISRVIAQQIILRAVSSTGGAAGQVVAGAGQALQGYATGGSWTVGGSGGTDSQLVAFRATPGERVDVRTPQQQQRQQQQAPSSPVHVQVVNSLDPREIEAVISSRAGERQILNVIRNNPAAVRASLRR